VRLVDSPTIAVRLWGWAAVLRILKRVVPLETLVRVMHRRAGNAKRSEAFERRLELYLERRGRFPFRPPSNCLERSLGVYRMLCRLNAAPQLVIGFRHAADKRVEGHVWVVVDGRALAEPPGALSTYTSLVTFDADARRRAASGSDAMLAQIRFT
jgi:hypothetical protein